MKAAIFTSKGAEHIASQEIKELIDQSSKTEETVVIFDIESEIDLCKIVYKAQSISKGILLITTFPVDPDLSRTLKNIDLNTSLIKKLVGNKSFCVECIRYGNHNFTSVDFNHEISKIISINNQIDYDNPQVKLLAYIYNNQGYFGIDFAGIELDKRQYKIFNHPQALKGTTGYALVREAGFSNNKILLDPFMGSGVIVIEAALSAFKFPVQYFNKDKLYFTRYDFFKNYPNFFSEQDNKISIKKGKIFGYDSQMKYLNASQKNSKLAGIEKGVSLSRVDAEWLDLKFEKSSIDSIVSDPPRWSKYREKGSLTKIYNELFYQAQYILKKAGSIVLLVKDHDTFSQVALNHKFKIKKNYTLYQGKEPFEVMVFEK